MMIRLYVPDSLSPGASFAFAEGQAHYLRHVMRREEGAEVLVFNERDGEWKAALSRVSKKETLGAVRERVREPRPCAPLSLWHAPLKKEAEDFVIQKATELGATEILPVMTQHTAVARLNVERLRAQAVEAAEQCERLCVPAVHEPVSWVRMLELWRERRERAQLFFMDERGGALAFAEALRKREPGLSPVVLIGPEGGFSAAERESLHALNDPHVISVTLGERILRADTAAVVALSRFSI